MAESRRSEGLGVTHPSYSEKSPLAWRKLVRVL